MADEFMYIPNENTQNYPPPLLCRLQYWLRLITQFNEPTNKNKNKVSKEFSKFWGLV